MRRSADEVFMRLLRPSHISAYCERREYRYDNNSADERDHEI